MRSTLHGPEEFLLKSKKPHIKSLIARLQEMSAEDIEKLDEKPDIRRGLLNIKKKHAQSEALKRAEKLADLMTFAHHPNLSKNG